MSAPGPIAKTLARVRAVSFFGITFGLVLLVGFWLVPLAVWLGKPNWIKRPCYLYVRAALYLFGVRIDLRGGEYLTTSRSVLILSNHQSFLDIPIMMGWIRWPSFLAKKEIESWPFFGGAMRLLHCVFVDRNDRRSRMQTGSRVREQMEHGVDFCIYPEGTRCVDGQLLPMRAGSAHIAVEASALVLPVAIDGTWKVLNKKGFRMYPGTVTVTILPPIDCALPENRDHKELMLRIESQIAQQLGQTAPSAANESAPL